MQSLQQVVLLHGLARTTNSLLAMELALIHAGYQAINIAYPSTEHDIDTLTLEHVWPQIEAKCDLSLPINIVSHSMGGIITRNLAAKIEYLHLGRVVMLCPPNQGSEIVDKLSGWWLFEQLNGPAGKQLSTAPDSKPNQLGRVNFELGVIAGEKSLNPILSTLFNGKNDGKVAVDKTKVSGMKDFIILDASHTFITMRPDAIKLTLRFLQHGYFDDN